jgi:hypothetical protein
MTNPLIPQEMTMLILNEDIPDTPFFDMTLGGGNGGKIVGE